MFKKICSDPFVVGSTKKDCGSMFTLFSPDSTNLFPIKRKWIANDFTEQAGQRNKAQLIMLPPEPRFCCRARMGMALSRVAVSAERHWNDSGAEIYGAV